MAATALTYTDLVANGGVQQPTGTALAADMAIADALPERTVLVVANTDDDTALTLTVKAGDNPPALAAGLGDKAITVAFGKTEFVGPFESGRFLQSDGSLSITANPTTGTIIPLLVPEST